MCLTVCLQPGIYVTLHIANVPVAVFGKFLVVWSNELVNLCSFSVGTLTEVDNAIVVIENTDVL